MRTMRVLEAERLLRKTGRFSETEISTICGAIRFHNSTGQQGSPYEVLLRDSALMECYLRNNNISLDGDQQNRLAALFAE
jgi:hypothetical protein